MPRLLLGLILALSALTPARAAEAPEPTPRIAVISAFAPELTALAAATADKRETTAGGVAFTTGTWEGKPVVLFLSGMSMVNAAMATQSALDRFSIKAIVFSGIAGGVDPGLDVGDVVAPQRWGQYLESVFARETPTGFAPPAGEGETLPNYGMMFPRGVTVAQTPGEYQRRFWFETDPALLAVARQAAGQVELKRCIADRCLVKPPRVVVGGSGVSGQSFVDNAAFRQYAFQTFQASVLDMESAAVAQVAYVNRTPFIAFRSLSDLAGGDPGANQARVFFQLASDNSAAVVRAFLRQLP
jgi:adenosylhomocysteine nucleosidase